MTKKNFEGEVAVSEVSGDKIDHEKIGERIFSIRGEISDTRAGELIEKILIINKHDEKQCKKLRNYKIEPIKFLVNSPGGGAPAMNSLLPIIHDSYTPIHMYGLGSISSAAFSIFLAGHKRFCYPFSFFMYHEVSSWTHGSLEHLKDKIDFLETIQKNYDEFILSRTKIEPKTLKHYRETKKDWYIFAQEALELGIVHGIC